ncbi:MAG TPA: hypothetical protein VGL99_29790 [Chloroflexota bacterium]
MTSRKLVILGGSSPNTPAFFEAGGSGWDEVCLVGRSAEKVERVGLACQAIVEQRQVNVRVTWDTDIRRAARGAAYVLNMLRVGGAAAVANDRQLLAASGIVGHAASYPEAIRHLAPTLLAAHTVQSVAPEAVFVNFANPVSILCEAIADETTLSCFGICHHAFSMRTDFARILDVSVSDVRVEYRGLNHLGWVTDVLVNGASALDELIRRLVQRRIKAYDYDLAPEYRAIPIKHAAALYHKGEVLYVRQAGPRSSAIDVVLRSGVGGAPFRGWLERRAARLEAGQRGGWYSRCIVPFLDALAGATEYEFIVTWRHNDAVPQVPGLTAEAPALVRGGQVRPTMAGSALPEAAQEWLRQVRTSERLLLRAVKERSDDTLRESLAIHPSVASVAHARDFVRQLRPFAHD